MTELSQTKTLTHVHGTKAIPNIAAADIGKAAATVLLEGPEKHAGKIYNLYAKEHLDANIGTLKTQMAENARNCDE